MLTVCVADTVLSLPCRRAVVAALAPKLLERGYGSLLDRLLNQVRTAAWRTWNSRNITTQHSLTQHTSAVCGCRCRQHTYWQAGTLIHLLHLDTLKGSRCTMACCPDVTELGLMDQNCNFDDVF